MEKVTILGVDSVGMTAAFYLAEKRVASIRLIDPDLGRAQGTGLDLFEAAPIRTYDGWIKGSDCFEEMKGSRVVVLASGLNGKEGSGGPERIGNLQALDRVMDQVARFAPDSVLIHLVEPVDILCYALIKRYGWNSRKVLGVSNVLDSTRFRQLIAAELNVSSVNTSALVLGSCGCKIILPRYARVEGIPIDELLDPETIQSLIRQVKEAGGPDEDAACKGTVHESGAAVAEIVESVVRDQGRIICGPVFLSGEYGMKGICLGLPLIVGRRGIHKIVELELNSAEKVLLDEAALSFRKSIEGLSRLRRPWRK